MRLEPARLARRPQPELTAAQLQVLLALMWCQHVEGRSTVRGLAEVTGRAVSTVHAHLQTLRIRGFVTWTPGQAGTLRLAVAVVVPRGFPGEAPWQVHG